MYACSGYIMCGGSKWLIQIFGVCFTCSYQYTAWLSLIPGYMEKLEINWGIIRACGNRLVLGRKFGYGAYLKPGWKYGVALEEVCFPSKTIEENMEFWIMQVLRLPVILSLPAFFGRCVLRSTAYDCGVQRMIAFINVLNGAIRWMQLDVYRYVLLKYLILKCSMYFTFSLEPGSWGLKHVLTT